MRRTLFNAFVLLAALGTGCSKMESSVQGMVTLDGKPLTRGTVSFHAVQQGATAYGHIGPDGAYRLKTGDSKGLASGSYKVTVVATEPIPADWPPNKTPPPGPLITPQRYGTVKTTDLTAEVGPGANQINLDLTSN